MCVVYIEHIKKFNIRILSGGSVALFKYKKGIPYNELSRESYKN